MRRTVMAVDTVHAPDVEVLPFVRLERGARIEVFRHSPLRIFDPHPRDLLPLRIGGAVIYDVGDVHVPVNAGGDAGRRAAAAGADQHLDLSRRVALVVAETV